MALPVPRVRQHHGGAEEQPAAPRRVSAHDVRVHPARLAAMVVGVAAWQGRTGSTTSRRRRLWTPSSAETRAHAPRVSWACRLARSATGCATMHNSFAGLRKLMRTPKT